MTAAATAIDTILAHRPVDPVEYWIAVFERGRGEHEAVLYPDSGELLAWVAAEGEFRAEYDLLEVIERRADGTMIRHDRDTIDAWCAERDADIEAERDTERELRSPYMTGRV